MKYEHLVVPKYFKLNNINGSTLTKILHTDDWLNELRKVYKEDPNLFFDIRDELILRGFSFERSIQNNFFPASSFTPSSYVKVHTDNKKFMRLNNEVTGIGHIIRRYQVQSDLFFNFITIEGIAHLVNKDAELIKRYLKDSHFEIIQTHEDENQTNLEPDERFDFGLLDDKTIEELFFGGKYTMFVKFCAANNITKMSDLNIDSIQKFSELLGVGKGKASDVTKRFYELQQQVVKVSESQNKYNTEDLTEFESRIKHFCDNELKWILEANDISYLAFLNDVYSEQNYPDIHEKIEQFSLRLPELKKTRELKEVKLQTEKLRMQILELPVYEVLKDFTWNILVDILGVRINQEEVYSECPLSEIIEDNKWHFVYSELHARMEVYKSVNESIKMISESLADREISILNLRGQNYTLEQVGKEFNVTRERVRQIEKKVVSKIQNQLQLLHIDEFIRKYLQQEELLSFDDIISYLTDDEKSGIVIRYFINTHSSFEIQNNVVVDTELNNHILKVVEKYKENNKMIIFTDELLNEINEDKRFEVSVEQLDFTMKNIAFMRNNNIYIYKSVKFPQLIEHIFKYTLNENPLELTDSNFEKLNILMKDTFGIVFENGKRAAIARIRDTNNIILIDSNTFVYRDLDLLPQSIIEDVEMKLNDVLAVTETTTASALFNKHRDTWHNYGINSTLYLYSIIQHHFNGQYQIGRGNTLSISKLESTVENASDVLTNLLRRNDNVLSKVDILDQLYWPTYKLEQLVGRYSEFIFVEIENNKYGIKLFSSYNFTENELERMRTFSRNFITEKYIYTQDLMSEMEFDNEMSAILAEKNIFKLYDFASILKMLMPEFRGFHQFLYAQDSDITVIEDALYKEYPELLTRDDLLSFLSEKGYSESSFASYIGDLLEKKYFYPYTSVKYINSNCIKINENILSEVKVFIEDVLTERDYISAYDLVGLSSLTKISDYPWEPNLLVALLREIGYTVIDTIKDYRYNKLLIINPSLSVKTIDELALQLISEEYKGNFHETDVAKFLKSKNLAYTSKIPLAIKTSPLFSFNEYGFIKLMEV